MIKRKMTERITAEQESALEAKLASDAQVKVAQMVAALPNEEPELFWRSELSAKLHQVAAQKERRRKVAWTLRPAVGICAVTALAVVFMAPRRSAMTNADSSPNVEAQILSAHREAVQLGTFWGSVRADDEARLASAPVKSEYAWDETDLGTL